MGSFALIQDLAQALRIFVSSGLFIDEVKHGLVTLIFALFFYYKTKSLKFSFIAFITTYLIDIDHLVDYFLYYGASFSFTQFIKLDNFALTRRAVVPFHAWEWFIFISALAYGRKNRNTQLFLAAVATGIFSHLIWDMITVDSFWFYSIIYRISQSFIVIT